ncbi:MAG: type II toxin-antitoxin system HicB family antitoxin [Desulfamplus sp.]|nr:type II toxin-antitoxin system HicB family antitoxin [Desulfamplus sp.]
MNKFEYPVLLTKAEEGGFVVTCRDLPELITQGENIDDAIEQAHDALEESIALRISDNLEIPNPSLIQKGEYKIALSLKMSAKSALYVAFKKV